MNGIYNPKQMEEVGLYCGNKLFIYWTHLIVDTKVNDDGVGSICNAIKHMTNMRRLELWTCNSKIQL